MTYNVTKTNQKCRSSLWKTKYTLTASMAIKSQLDVGNQKHFIYWSSASVGGSIKAGLLVRRNSSVCWHNIKWGMNLEKQLLVLISLERAGRTSIVLQWKRLLAYSWHSGCGQNSQEWGFQCYFTHWGKGHWVMHCNSDPDRHLLQYTVFISYSKLANQANLKMCS